MRQVSVLGLGLVLAFLALPALAQDPAPEGPLSAINWLSVTASQPRPLTGAFPVTPADGQTLESGISVRPLDALRPEAIGLYPAARVGLLVTAVALVLGRRRPGRPRRR